MTHLLETVLRRLYHLSCPAGSEISMYGTVSVQLQRGPHR
jgi:hypothetical protein